MLAGNVVTAAIREASLREQHRQRQRKSSRCRRASSRSPSASQQLAALAARRRGRAASASSRRRAPRCRSCSASSSSCGIGWPSTVGDAARHGADSPKFRLADLELPAELPLSLPSRAGAAAARISARRRRCSPRPARRVGVATANLYPQFTLSANVGLARRSGGDLFGSGSGFYLLGAVARRSRSFAAASCRPGAAPRSRPTSRPAPAYQEVGAAGSAERGRRAARAEADAEGTRGTRRGGDASHGATTISPRSATRPAA